MLAEKNNSRVQSDRLVGRSVTRAFSGAWGPALSWLLKMIHKDCNSSLSFFPFFLFPSDMLSES